MNNVAIVVIKQPSELYFLSRVYNNTRLGLFSSFIHSGFFFLYVVFSIIHHCLLSFHRFFFIKI
jgi:hypothetical protein